MTISSTRAKQLIKSGCIAFLATIVDRNGETPRIEDILIVQEFANVFPAEMLCVCLMIERSSLW